MTEKLVATEHYVASLDLLAGKALIYNDEQFEHLNRINNIYTSWITIGKHATFAEKLKIKIFSDNIIIATENTGQRSLEDLLEFVGDMAEHFLSCGYKLRGGLAKGELYIDDIFVWGKGLVSAYLLENDSAIYPRILISDSVYADISDRTKNRMIIKDIDSLYYFNYLKGYGKGAKGYLKTIDTALDKVTAELSQENLDIKVRAKLGWLENFLKENKSYWLSELK